MALAVLLLILLLVGIVAGLLGSLSGLGGGVVIVPLLVVAFHVPVIEAIGASAVSVLATSTATGAAYVRDRLTDVRIGMFLEIATVPGALFGVTATLLLARFGLTPLLLTVLGAVLLLTVPGSLIRPADPGRTGRPDPRSREWNLRGSYYDWRLLREVPYEAERTTPALGTMFGAGAVSGMFGIGGGVLKVLALEWFLGLPTKVATATSNFMIGVTVAASAGVLLLAGDVNPVIAGPVALGTAAGSLVGSRILPGLSSRRVAAIFLGLVAALGVELLLRGLGIA